MTHLPETIDFDETAFPELAHIFRGIDAGITALLASDPAFRPKLASKRRRPANAKVAFTPRPAPRKRRAAA
jgi:hypothetical protein